MKLSVSSQVNPKRRRLIAAIATALNTPTAKMLSAGLGALSVSGPATAQSISTDEPARLALVLGNGSYVEPYDLPPIAKNVRDLSSSLSQLGFTVVEGLDLSLPGMTTKVNEFMGLLNRNPDALVFFYFSGHGMQQRAENLLLSLSAQPNADADAVLSASMRFSQEVLNRLSQRNQGTLLAAIDACRTDIRAALAEEDGLNQVEAPENSIVIFSTEAGRPAISPSSPDQNTFFTASLIKMMGEVPSETRFSDLFRLVRQDVQQTMSNHPLQAIRDLTQRPFIADNSRAVSYVFPASERARLAEATSLGEEQDFEELQASIWPPQTLKLAKRFIANYPRSKSIAATVVAQIGARDAITALRKREVKLFKSAFTDLQNEPGLLDDLRRAAKGDKDAAARIGRWVARNSDGTKDSFRYEGWLQYATFLGNGIASYELALHYREVGQVQQAGFFEAKAKELGYTPPVSLTHKRS